MTTDLIIALAVIGGGAILLTLKYAHEHVKTHGIHKITFRALTGRRTDGKRHTNASFWRKSDGIVRGHPVGRVGKRHHRAGIANLARTIGWIAAIGLTVYGLRHSVMMTVILGGIALIGFLGFKGYHLIRRARVWYVNRTVVNPLAEALGPMLDLTGPEAETLVVMKPDYLTRKTGEIGRINLPPRYAANPGQREMINHLVTSRLPVGSELEWKTNQRGRAPHVLIHAAPSLPSLVKFSDYATAIEAIGKGAYLAGIDQRADGYIAEFKGEEPHHGYCWGTGVGKSTMLKSILAQCKHNEPDMTASIIDPKELSLACLKGVPGFDFYDDAGEFELRIPGLTPDNYEDYMPGMWKGFKSVYTLMRHRFELMKDDPTREFPTHYVMVEEANSFSIMSRTWWQKNRPRGIQGGVTPPVWADYIAPIFWRGRQANIKIVLVAQSIQERFLGNLNLRPSLGLVSLAKYKPAQYQNYIGTTPIPKMQRGKGRALFNDGESDTWVQSLLASDGEFRDFAMANLPVVGASVPMPRTEPTPAGGVHVITSVPAPRSAPA
jgi:hypothetical protein